MRRTTTIAFCVGVGASALALSGCVPEPAAPNPLERPEAPPEAVYLGVQTRLLSDELVNIVVTMRGTGNEEDVDEYARCAAAQYTLIRGYGFARHVRTRVAEEGSLWLADAVYTISPTLPRGVQTIDAEVTVEDCMARGIPTV